MLMSEIRPRRGHTTIAPGANPGYQTTSTHNAEGVEP